MRSILVITKTSPLAREVYGSLKLLILMINTLKLLTENLFDAGRFQVVQLSLEPGRLLQCGCPCMADFHFSPRLSQ
jgi:hypothetical protein